MRLGRLGLRRRLQASVIGAVALVLVVLIGAFNLVLRERLSNDADNVLVSRASAELASVHPQGGRLAIPEAPDAAALDSQTWVFAGTRALERPHSDPVTERAARSLISGPRRRIDVTATHTRLYAIPIVAGRRRLGTVVAELSLKPYEGTAQTALVASLVLGVVVLAVVALAAQLLISGALRPVAQMTERAATWSETDTGRRFGLGPPRDEFTRLAATLDALLDRVASSLRHEQRFSAEISHELRTPLASVIAEAQLALRHPRSPQEERAGYERVLVSAQLMARTLETLVTAARVEAQRSHGTGDAAAAARSAARGCASVAAARGIEVTVAEPGRPIRLGVDNEVAERVLAPLIENACRYGASSVTVGAERRDGAVLFVIRDDGPGVAPADCEKVFEPGWRSDAAAAAHAGGAGLGLALARRLARAVGGDVKADSGGGGDFRARLPAG
jgi:signal transduction histidine kinase